MSEKCRDDAPVAEQLAPGHDGHPLGKTPMNLSGNCPPREIIGVARCH